MSFNKVTTRDTRGDSGKCKATGPDARKKASNKAQTQSSKGSRMRELLGEIERVLARKT